MWYLFSPGQFNRGRQTCTQLVRGLRLAEVPWFDIQGMGCIAYQGMMNCGLREQEHHPLHACPDIRLKCGPQWRAGDLWGKAHREVLAVLLQGNSLHLARFSTPAFSPSRPSAFSHADNIDGDYQADPISSAPNACGFPCQKSTTGLAPMRNITHRKQLSSAHLDV